MSPVWIGCVVEGEGEVQALPILIRRIAQRIDPGLCAHAPRPVRIKRTRVSARFGDLEEGVQTVVQQIQPPGAIFVLLDADDDCPATFGPDLLQRLQAFRGDIAISVVLAKREFEAWFLAAAESIRGQRGLPTDLTPPTDPEAVRDAKGWLRSKMPGARKYSENSDQPALTALFDLDMALSRSDSFSKCYREIERLLRSLLPPAEPG